jgi:transcriptional regulator with XRE-family HTH domain
MLTAPTTTLEDPRIAGGRRLKEERLRLRLTQVDMAHAGGVSKTSQINYESGDRAPDTDYLRAVAAKGVDVLYVVLGQVSRLMDEGPQPGDLVPIAKLAPELPLGNKVRGNDSGFRLDVLSVSRGWLQERGLSAHDLRALVVVGSSMQGVVDDGDVVLVDIADTKPRSGFVYVLRHGDELLVKYCEQMPDGRLRISSANAAFTPYELDPASVTDFAVLGRVRGSLHER